MLAARDRARLDEAVAAVASSGDGSQSGRCAGVVLDMRDVSSFPRVIDGASRLIPDHAGFDIIVNSAGVHGDRDFGSVDETTWDAVLDTNVKGPYFLAQAGAAHMKERRLHGNILMVGSASALKPGWTPYEISKRAVESMTLGLADRLVGAGVTVNCLAPGPVATPMMGRGADGDLCSTLNPSGRFATPEEMANLAVVLVSPLGSLVVGSSLYATGGSGTVSLD